MRRVGRARDERLGEHAAARGIERDALGGQRCGPARAGERCEPRVEGHGRLGASERHGCARATREAPAYTLKRPSRRKPTSVSPRRRAASTARLEGAPTAHSTGMPATAAFWTSSNEARPETSATELAERRRAGEHAVADDLVERVVAADVLAHERQLAVGREQPGRVQPAGALERPLRGAQALGQLADDHRRDDRSFAQWLGGDLDGVDRGLAAHAAGRRHAEVALHQIGLERPPEVHRDDVVGLLAELDVGAVLDLGELERRSQEALGVQEARGELEVVAGRAHRDCDAHRLLARPRGADLERLLTGEAVAALPPDAVLHGEHARVDGRAAQRWAFGGRHGALLLPPRAAPARAGSRSGP